MGVLLTEDSFFDFLVSLCLNMRLVINKDPSLKDIQLSTDPNEIRLLLKLFLLVTSALIPQFFGPVSQLIAKEGLGGALRHIPVGVRDPERHLPSRELIVLFRLQELLLTHDRQLFR